MNNLQKIVSKIIKKKLTKQHLLTYLFWECTLRCNLNCLHCGNDCLASSSIKDMPFDDFARALSTIPYNIRSKITVIITGGEPLVRKDIAECGKEIRAMGFRWGMVSNALLYDQQTHINLLNSGIGSLTFSLDGLEKNHNWLRNNSISFSKVDKAIDLVVQSPRINFDIVTCVNQKNISELQQIYEYLLSKNVRQWRLFTISPIGRAKNDTILHLHNIQFQTLMNFIVQKRKENKINVKFSCEGYVDAYEMKVRDTFFFCRAGINIASVLIDGSICACPNIDRNFAQGNIYKDNFYSVWQNKYQIFRDRNWLKQGICKDCSKFAQCLGNGFHLWQKDKPNVLVCHRNMLH